MQYVRNVGSIHVHMYVCMVDHTQGIIMIFDPSKHVYQECRNRIVLAPCAAWRDMELETERRYTRLFDMKMQSGIQLIRIVEEAIKDEI